MHNGKAVLYKKVLDYNYQKKNKSKNCNYQKDWKVALLHRLPQNDWHATTRYQNTPVAKNASWSQSYKVNLFFSIYFYNFKITGTDLNTYNFL